MLALFNTVSGATRPSEAGSGASSPPVALEVMSNLLTRVATALDIKLVDSDDSPSVPISAEFREALQESWASARGCFQLTAETGPWSYVAGAESLGFWEYPTMDNMIAAMVLPRG
jgi:hypothetical protein